MREFNYETYFSTMEALIKELRQRALANVHSAEISAAYVWAMDAVTQALDDVKEQHVDRR